MSRDDWISIKQEEFLTLPSAPFSFEYCYFHVSISMVVLERANLPYSFLAY
jgi:hypothetical protein